MPVPTEEERLDTVIGGKYRIDRLLGRGGVGVVYAGAHEWTGRQVAVKLLHPEYARHPEVVRRFLREARSAAALQHRHVVDILDMGEDDDHTVYLVMEHLEGESLADVLAREGSLSPSRTLAIVLPVMDALAAAHDRRIVHRDLKPDNIFIHYGPNGEMEPKLLDFGIAKVLDEPGAAPAWTKVGEVLGTPHYMAPEQAEGADEVGPPADVWAMGVILYESVSGQLPFDGPSLAAIIRAVTLETHTPLRERGEFPAELCDAVEWALRRDPAQRPAHMGELADALRASGACEYEASAAHETPAQRQTPSSMGILPRTPALARDAHLRRGAKLAIALAALGILAVGAGASAFAFGWLPASMIGLGKTSSEASAGQSETGEPISDTAPSASEDTPSDAVSPDALADADAHTDGSADDSDALPVGRSAPRTPAEESRSANEAAQRQPSDGQERRTQRRTRSAEQRAPSAGSPQPTPKPASKSGSDAPKEPAPSKPPAEGDDDVPGLQRSW